MVQISKEELKVINEINQILPSKKRLELRLKATSTNTGYEVTKEKITALSLNSCRLTVFPDEILELPSLKRLYLNSNSLTKVPDEIFQLKNLHRLSMKNNNLNTITIIDP